MERIFLIVGAVMGALGVAAGAFAAHGLKSRLAPDLLARTSHQHSAADDDAQCPTVFSRIGMLDGLSSTTPRPSGRKPRWARRLAALATKVGEKCGLAVFETGARYQLTHALALLAVGLVMTRFPHPATTASGWLFIVGVVVFAGSLYVLALTGARWLGAITPVGGLALILGWLALAWGVFSSR